MKAIFIIILLATTATAEPTKPEPTAAQQVVITRAKWDAAVAAGHPVEAGVWARRHFAALQAVRKAERPVRARVRSQSPVRGRR